MIDVVNGYVCHNCSDVALAKRDIDPAHPKDGPDGRDKVSESATTDRNRAVTFGGALAAASGATDPGQIATSSATAANSAGKVLYLSV